MTFTWWATLAFLARRARPLRQCRSAPQANHRAAAPSAFSYPGSHKLEAAPAAEDFRRPHERFKRGAAVLFFIAAVKCPAISSLRAAAESSSRQASRLPRWSFANILRKVFSTARAVKGFGSRGVSEALGPHRRVIAGCEDDGTLSANSLSAKAKVFSPFRLTSRIAPPSSSDSARARP